MWKDLTLLILLHSDVGYMRSNVKSLLRLNQLIPSCTSISQTSTETCHKQIKPLNEKMMTGITNCNEPVTWKLWVPFQEVFTSFNLLPVISSIDRPGSLPPLSAGCWELHWQTCCCGSAQISSKASLTSAGPPAWGKTPHVMSKKKKQQGITLWKLTSVKFLPSRKRWQLGCGPTVETE